MAVAGGVARVKPFARARPRGLVLHFLIVLSVVSGVAALSSGSSAALSSALGVGLAGANLWVMRRILAAMTADGASAAWAVVLPFKLFGLVASAFALVRLELAEPVPLAIGFALLPLTGVFLPRASSVPGLVVPGLVVPRSVVLSRPAPPGQPL